MRDDLRRKLLLYAVTDRSWLHGQTMIEQIEEALKGGITCLQLREKHLSKEEFEKEAKEVQALCKRYEVPFLINDDVELAYRLDADGVHVGQRDMRVKEARKILGENKIIGVSARTVEQALAAEKDGADYLGVGAVFPTGSKEDAVQINHETLKAICEAVQIPVIAIGGINEKNVEHLAGSGICGVAVISAIFAKKNISKAAEELKKKAMEMIV